MSGTGESHDDEVRVRRAPKYSAFLIVGGGIGAIVAFILTGTREVDPEVGFIQMFLLLALFGVTIGMLLGGVIALAFDRAYSRRATTVIAERSEIVAPPHQPVTEPAIEGLPDAAQEPGTGAEPEGGEPDAVDGTTGRRPDDPTVRR